MKKWNWWLFFLCLGLNACKNNNDPNHKILVAVAANAQYPIEKIKRLFEKETGVDVELVVGSSGKLTTQIRQGAPYDVFLSADTNFPDTLYKSNLTVDPPVIYALGTLVMWTTKDIDFSTGLRVLNDPAVKKVAIANPTTAPYGRAALDVLSNSNVYSLELHNKIVYGESIAQVNQYVISGNCDIGFTAKSVVLSPEMKDKGKWVEIKAGYEPLPQAMVLLEKGFRKHPQLAQAFFDFVLSAKAQAIFLEFGYQLPDKKFEPQER